MTLICLATLLLIGVVVQLISSRHAGEGLKYDFRFSRDTVECDEVFQLETTVENLKRLPVLYLKLRETVPDVFRVELGNSTVREHLILATASSFNRILEQTLFIMGRQRLTRKLDASLPARGRYQFLHASVETGDFLGLREYRTEVPLFREIVVLPRPLSAPGLDAALGGYMGDVSLQRFIYPDPILKLGFHEYTGHEPMKDIYWPRSLRDDRLMVKEYDYTAESTACVVLNTDSPDGTPPELFEKCFSIARYVCERLDRSKVSYSFYTNALTVGSMVDWNYIPGGKGQTHLMSILEGLGRAVYGHARSFSSLVNTACLHSTDDNMLIVITPRQEPEAAAILRRHELRSGRRALVIKASEVSAL